MKKTFITLNTREYITSGQYVIIKRNDKDYCRFLFNDYESEKECIEAAENLCKLLNYFQKI